MAVSAVLVMERLRTHWPELEFELSGRDPWHLLVAALIQSRSSPQRAAQLAACIGEQFAGPAAVAALHPCELEPFLPRLAQRREKARAIVESGRMIRDRHQGQVPSRQEELLRLPGVNRQVAALVQARAFGLPAVVADEHLQRVLRRLGLIAEEDALAAEVALQHDLPPQAWAAVSARLSHLGRAHCRPKVARCRGCPLAADCPSSAVAMAG